MAKRKPSAGQAPAGVGQPAWRNRIVGHGEVDPESVLANPGNWRIHPEGQQRALAGAIGDVGIVQTVLVNRRTSALWPDGQRGVETLVDGHLRVTLALRSGQRSIPVTYVDLAPGEEAEVLATLDPISAMAAADAGKLDELLREVSTGDAAVQAMLAELAKDAGLYKAPAGEDPGAQVDKAAELQAKWQTVTGQLWLIPSKSVAGKAHRLLCGDSTKVKDVDRLMGADRAATLITSPPYWTGQEYDGKPGERGARAFIVAIVGAWAERITRRVQIQTGQSNSTMLGDKGPMRKVLLDAFWTESLLAHGWLLRHRRIWAKGGSLPHTNPVADVIDESWEYVLTYYRADQNEGGQERVGEPWAQAGVWADVAPERKGDSAHPCPFPVELAARMIRLYSTGEDVVVEPFVGSGSTIVAAEQTGRLCYGMEIEPKYIAVALERLAGLGLEPRLSE